MQTNRSISSRICVRRDPQYARAGEQCVRNQRKVRLATKTHKCCHHVISWRGKAFCPLETRAQQFLSMLATLSPQDWDECRLLTLNWFAWPWVLSAWHTRIDLAHSLTVCLILSILWDDPSFTSSSIIRWFQCQESLSACPQIMGAWFPYLKRSGH